MKAIIFSFVLLVLLSIPRQTRAEFRSAKEMQKECRVALQVMGGTAENNATNALLAGECVGYVQGAADASLALSDNVSWYKVCLSDNLSTASLIEKFIAFVDANPKYTLASTAIQMMLAREYPCHK
jgi:Rap1a immunity proteins